MISRHLSVSVDRPLLVLEATSRGPSGRTDLHAGALTLFWWHIFGTQSDTASLFTDEGSSSRGSMPLLIIMQYASFVSGMRDLPQARADEIQAIWTTTAWQPLSE